MINEEKLLDITQTLIGGFSPNDRVVKEAIEILEDMIGNHELYDNWLKRIEDNPYNGVDPTKFVKYQIDMFTLEYYKLRAASLKIGKAAIPQL